MTKEVMSEVPTTEVQATEENWFSSREDAIISSLGEHGAFSVSAKTNRLIVDLRHMKRDAGDTVKSVIISECRRLGEAGESLSVNAVKKQFRFVAATGKEVEQAVGKGVVKVTPEVFTYLKQGSRFESYGVRNISFLLASSTATATAPAQTSVNAKVDTAAADAASSIIEGLTQ
jgi:hypothetical protein